MKANSTSLFAVVLLLALGAVSLVVARSWAFAPEPSSSVRNRAVTSVPVLDGARRDVVAEEGQARKEVMAPQSLLIRTITVSGHPVPGARVYAVNGLARYVLERKSRLLGVAGATGVVEIRDAIKRGQWLAAYADGYTPAFARVSDSGRVELVLRPGNVLTLLLEWPDGGPAEGVWVTLSAVGSMPRLGQAVLPGPDPSTNVHSFKTDERGRVVLPWLGSGPQNVRLVGEAGEVLFPFGDAGDQIDATAGIDRLVLGTAFAAAVQAIGSTVLSCQWDSGEFEAAPYSAVTREVESHALRDMRDRFPSSEPLVVVPGLEGQRARSLEIPVRIFLVHGGWREVQVPIYPLAEAREHVVSVRPGDQVAAWPSVITIRDAGGDLLDDHGVYIRPYDQSTGITVPLRNGSEVDLPPGRFRLYSFDRLMSRLLRGQSFEVTEGRGAELDVTLEQDIGRVLVRPVDRNRIRIHNSKIFVGVDSAGGRPLRAVGDLALMWPVGSTLHVRVEADGYQSTKQSFSSWDDGEVLEVLMESL